MRDMSSAVTHDCVNAENERYFYINMKLFIALYRRSEYRFDLRRKHSKFTAARMMNYAIKSRRGLVDKHRAAMIKRRAIVDKQSPIN